MWFQRARRRMIDKNEYSKIIKCRQIICIKSDRRRIVVNTDLLMIVQWFFHNYSLFHKQIEQAVQSGRFQHTAKWSDLIAIEKNHQYSFVVLSWSLQLLSGECSFKCMAEITWKQYGAWKNLLFTSHDAWQRGVRRPGNNDSRIIYHGLTWGLVLNSKTMLLHCLLLMLISRLRSFQHTYQYFHTTKQVLITGSTYTFASNILPGRCFHFLCPIKSRHYYNPGNGPFYTILLISDALVVALRARKNPGSLIFMVLVSTTRRCIETTEIGREKFK